MLADPTSLGCLYHLNLCNRRGCAVFGTSAFFACMKLRAHPSLMGHRVSFSIITWRMSRSLSSLLVSNAAFGYDNAWLDDYRAMWRHPHHMGPPISYWVVCGIFLLKYSVLDKIPSLRTPLWYIHRKKSLRVQIHICQLYRTSIAATVIDVGSPSDLSFVRIALHSNYCFRKLNISHLPGLGCTFCPWDAGMFSISKILSNLNLMSSIQSSIKYVWCVLWRFVKSIYLTLGFQFDSNGVAGGCQDMYTIIPDSNGTDVCCPNVTSPVLSANATVSEPSGPMSQYGFINQV